MFFCRALDNGEIKYLREAGIVELDLLDGGKWEMSFFDDEGRLCDFIAENSVWHSGTWKEYGNQLLASGKLKENYLEKYADRKKIIGFGKGRTFFAPYPEVTGQKFVFVVINELERGVLLTYQDIDDRGEFKSIFFDGSGKVQNIRQVRIFIETSLIIPTE